MEIQTANYSSFHLKLNAAHMHFTEVEVCRCKRRQTHPAIRKILDKSTNSFFHRHFLRRSTCHFRVHAPTEPGKVHIFIFSHPPPPASWSMDHSGLRTTSGLNLRHLTSALFHIQIRKSRSLLQNSEINIMFCISTGLQGVTAGFYGLIRKLTINGENYNLVLSDQGTGQPSSGLNTVNMIRGAEDMCFMSPCEHGGICSILDNQIRCDCPKGFLGDRCQLRGMSHQPFHSQYLNVSSPYCRPYVSFDFNPGNLAFNQWISCHRYFILISFMPDSGLIM